MKFLCVPCDQPMRLAEVAPPDRGSLAVRYACPTCGYEMAMLTNPYETQVVSSLGVRIGPEQPAAGSDPRADASGATASACPFAAMIPSVGEAAGESDRSVNGAAADVSEVVWTPSAEARLENIPAFVRPMARTGIERFARERGCARIDEALLDEARSFFGM